MGTRPSQVDLEGHSPSHSQAPSHPAASELGSVCLTPRAWHSSVPVARAHGEEGVRVLSPRQSFCDGQVSSLRALAPQVSAVRHEQRRPGSAPFSLLPRQSPRPSGSFCPPMPPPGVSCLASSREDGARCWLGGSGVFNFRSFPPSHLLLFTSQNPETAAARTRQLSQPRTGQAVSIYPHPEAFGNPCSSALQPERGIRHCISSEVAVSGLWRAAGGSLTCRVHATGLSSDRDSSCHWLVHCEHLGP